MSREICPRCGLMADAVETIKAERMPDLDGARRYDLVGHVYYHPGDKRCGVPRVGESYLIRFLPSPKGIASETTAAPIYPRDRGTGDDARY